MASALSKRWFLPGQLLPEERPEPRPAERITHTEGITHTDTARHFNPCNVNHAYSTSNEVDVA